MLPGIIYIRIGDDVEKVEQPIVIWTEYLKYKAGLRGFQLSKIENILKHSSEKYFDTVSQRSIAVGKHDDKLVMIPYGKRGNEITPATIHATTRQQIKFRLKTGRFVL